MKRDFESSKKFSIHNEVTFIDIIHFFLYFKKIMITAVVTGVIIGSIFYFQNKNVYRSEIPITFNFGDHFNNYDISYAVSLLHSAFLEKNFNYDFYSNFNADNKSISSPLEVKFENSIIKILYDSKKKLDDSDINRIIHSINYAIEKNNNNLLLNFIDTKSYDLKEPYKIIFDINAKITDNMILLDKLILEIENKYKVKENSLIIDAIKDKVELFSFNPNKAMLFIKTQIFTKLLSNLTYQNKIDLKDYNLYLYKFSLIQKNIDQEIYLIEVLNSRAVIPFVVQNKSVKEKLNINNSINLINIIMAFIILTIAISSFLCLIYLYLKNQYKEIKVVI